MITSKQIIKFCEAYVDSAKSRYNKKQLTTLFENPTSSEFKELFNDEFNTYKEVRFFIDNTTKKVYVWNAEVALHGDIAKILGIYDRFHKTYPDDMLVGIADIKNGKSEWRSCDMLESIYHSIKTKTEVPKDREYFTTLVNTDWSWAYKYVDCSAFIDIIKEVLKK